MPGTFSPPPWVSNPDMQHDTSVTHVSWFMPGSLTSGFLWSRWRENVPGIPGACVIRNFTYLARDPLGQLYQYHKAIGSNPKIHKQKQQNKNCVIHGHNSWDRLIAQNMLTFLFILRSSTYHCNCILPQRGFHGESALYSVSYVTMTMELSPSNYS